VDPKEHQRKGKDLGPTGRHFTRDDERRLGYTVSRWQIPMSVVTNAIVIITLILVAIVVLDLI
jgi:hypothetical protein